MSTTALDSELQAFAVELFERGGGIADWPAPHVPGSVVVPAEIAASAQLPGEEFSIGMAPAAGTMHVNLAGDFLDAANRLLEVAVSRDGSFSIPNRYLTSRDLADKIAATFSWQNARASCRAAEPALVSYHLWTLHALLKSEDVWEGLVRFGVNAESQAVLDLPDVFREPDLQDDPSDSCAEPSTYGVAIEEAKRRMMSASVDFVRRIEQRLARDRKRIQDYYHALSREAGGSKRRAATPPSPDEVTARKRAVELELRRKLAELNEQYALRATLRPVIVARVQMPALVVLVRIQRKQATREYRLYWNSLLKKLEPLACSRCLRATFSPAFANDTVDVICKICQAEKAD